MATLPAGPTNASNPTVPFLVPGFDTFGGLPGFIDTTTSGQNEFGRQQSQDVFNQQQSFLNALSPNMGLNANQAGIFGQQQGLANQYQQLATGAGPSVAQSMLSERTGQNIQSQAALMGSARGAQANPGMIARQASIQGGNVQQQATGQAASLRAQEQLNAMANLQNQQRAMAGLATQGQAQQQAAIGQLATQGTNIQSSLEQAIATQNQQRLGKYGADQGVSINSANNNMQLLGSAVGAAGTLGAAGLAGGAAAGTAAAGGAASAGVGAGALVGLAALSKGGVAGDAHPLIAYSKLSSGGKVGGQAKTQGDSTKNDTVPAMLSPGEVVIPKSHVNNPSDAAEFLNALMGWKLRAA